MLSPSVGAAEAERLAALRMRQLRALPRGSVGGDASAAAAAYVRRVPALGAVQLATGDARPVHGDVRRLWRALLRDRWNILVLGATLCGTAISAMLMTNLYHF